MALGGGSCSVDDSGGASAVTMGGGLGRGCMCRCVDAVVAGDRDGETSERSATSVCEQADECGSAVGVCNVGGSDECAEAGRAAH